MEAADSFRAVAPIYNYMTSHFKKTVTLTENRFLYLYVHAAQTFLSFLSLKM